MKDGPLRDPSKLFQERYVRPNVASTLSYLDEPFVAISQNASEIENILVAHDVCDHRRAIEIRLDAIGSQALN